MGSPHKHVRKPRPDLDWQDDAACHTDETMPPDEVEKVQALFFVADNERGPDREIREATAKAVCRQCPVEAPCLEYALAKPERDGVWGGLTEEERAGVRRKRMRQASRGAA